MGSDLQTLADRLEGLSGADRETDALVACALEDFSSYDLNDTKASGHPNEVEGLLEVRVGCIRYTKKREPYTSSLDAVVALVERVLKPLSLQVTILSNGSTSAVLGTSASPFQFVALAPTAPLALLRALVAAKIQEVGNE